MINGYYTEILRALAAASIHCLFALAVLNNKPVLKPGERMPVCRFKMKIFGNLSSKLCTYNTDILFTIFFVKTTDKNDLLFSKVSYLYSCPNLSKKFNLQISEISIYITCHKQRSDTG